MIEKEIRSVQDLLVELEADNEGYDGSIWYRGQSRKEWPLLPGYLRLNQPPSEATLIKRFKQSAAMLVQNTPNQSFDWLFLMQHYGVPTRLLDWSESPLVALYFAVDGDSDGHDEDAALWSLRPSELNKNAGINNVDEEFFIPSFEDIELTNYSVENLAQNQRTQLRPLATIATRNNARIQAQHGVFTIHHHERVPIEEIGDASHVVKYIIPGDSRNSIVKQLSLLGYTKFQLFPELASIGHIIKGNLL
ncbi:FRG domain-containing protein [Alcanivorax sp. NBRC 102024]|uniref:FRG domain-containing protein n=1 Tax=Alcanivorax sp. NBRC 102024 TaxID=1113895 RepID=UPI000789F386|nr:FRG domain-containing protein [Alcanivorax sp. NBRC 102024]